MEPIGPALAVISAFKEVYLTAKFIRNAAKTVKDFRSEKGSLSLQYRVQIVRLKVFWQLFSGNGGNQMNDHSLDTMPKEILSIVVEIMAELRGVFVDYSRLAGSIDADYQKHYAARDHFKQVQGSYEFPLDIDEEFTIADTDSNKTLTAERAQPQAKKKKSGIGLGRFFGKSTQDLSPTAAGANPVHFSVTDIPAGAKWLVQKGRLQSTLQTFRDWNDNLDYLLPAVINVFSPDHAKIRQLMDNDQDVKKWESHINLKTLSDSPNEVADSDGIEAQLQITWPEMEKKIDSIKTKFAAHFHETKVASPEGAGTEFNTDRATFLAKLLITAGHRDEYSASLRVPPLNSYAKHPEEPRYIYLFDFPRGTSARKPVSLHDQITSKEPEDRLSLNDRFRVAKTIARSLGAFHSDGWLHKSIRSHAVKFFFAEGGSTPDPTNPYLTDFEFSRPDKMDTGNIDRPVQIEQDIYRHPDRFGPPTDRFRKVHDVYALGVVLLEIGLWRTAISLYNEFMEKPLEGRKKEDLTGKKIQKEFLRLARERLSHQMGSAYKEAVIKCLDGSLGNFHGTNAMDRDFVTMFQREIVRKIELSQPREMKTSNTWDE